MSLFQLYVVGSGIVGGILMVVNLVIIDIKLKLKVLALQGALLISQLLCLAFLLANK